MTKSRKQMTRKERRAHDSAVRKAHRLNNKKPKEPNTTAEALRHKIYRAQKKLAAIEELSYLEEERATAYVRLHHSNIECLNKRQLLALYRQSLPGANRYENRDDRLIARELLDMNKGREDRFDTKADENGIHFYLKGTSDEIPHMMISHNPDHYVQPNKPRDPNFDYDAPYPVRRDDESVQDYCRRSDWYTYHIMSDDNPN